MMFLRRLMLRRKLRNGAKVDSIYTVISMYNEFGQSIHTNFQTFKRLI